MKAQRRLALAREQLSPLDVDDMLGVVGATHIATDCGCVTHGNTCDACNVPTLPVNGCPSNLTFCNVSRCVCE